MELIERLLIENRRMREIIGTIYPERRPHACTDPECRTCKDYTDAMMVKCGMLPAERFTRPDGTEVVVWASAGVTK